MESKLKILKPQNTCNKNMVPGDKRSPFVTSGVRLDRHYNTGLKETHMEQLALWINEALRNPENEAVHIKIKQEVLELCSEFPVYPNL